MDFVEQLKSSVDIVAVIGQYVRLKRVGAGPRYMGLCPFHAEKTPSFSVHGAHQFYKCFGCGLGGDVIKFVMEIDRLSFYEALKLLAERHGIPMPRRTEYSDPETKLRAAVYRLHEIAFQVFRAALDGPAGAEARAYLLKRRVAPALVEEFGLGYSERSGQALVRAFEKEGFDAGQMEASGLVLKRQDSSGFFDRFRNRLMFPIHSESAKIIGFGGRALSAEDEPKYLNSPETSIYRKSYVLYNLHRAKTEIRKQDRAVLVEGYMDVIGVWGAGVREPVASCGTALTSQQVRMLKRHSERMVVNFDADAAGVGAAERSIQMLLEEGMQVRVLELEGGLDPDEYVQEHGAEAYRHRLENAPGYFHWLADRARVRFDARTAEGRIASLKFLLPAIQRVSDKLERMSIANDIGGYLGVPQGAVLDHFRKAAAERRDAGPAPARQAVRPLEGFLLNALLASEEARLEVLPKLKSMPALQQFSTRRIFQALLAVSETQSRFTFAELEGRLDDNDKEVLASLVFADEGNEEKNSLEQALACLRSLEQGDLQSQRAALRAHVREAERAGNLAEALKWTEELNRLDRT